MAGLYAPPPPCCLFFSCATDDPSRQSANSNDGDLHQPFRTSVSAFRRSSMSIAGADEFLAFPRPILQEAITVHHGHMPEIEITSPSTAAGVRALQDVIMWPDGTHMQGYGHNHEIYELVGGEWKIKSSTLTRLHIHVTTPGS
jgi:hypothetical protein